jgi:hypothetical protein
MEEEGETLACHVTLSVWRPGAEIRATVVIHCSYCV